MPASTATSFCVRPRMWAACVVLAAALACGSWAVRAADAGGAPASPPSAAVFGALPQVTEVELSPGGGLLAWAVDQGEKGRVVVAMDVASGATKRTFPLGATGKLRDLTWHDDETLLVTIGIAHEVTLDNGREDMWEITRTISLDLNGGEPKILMPENARTFTNAATIVAFRTSQPKTLLLSRADYSFTAENSTIDTRIEKTRRDSGWISRLYAVDVRSGRAKIVEAGTQFTQEWIVDRDGRVVARTEWEPKTNTFRLLAKRGGGWPEIYSRTDGRELSVLSVSDDGRSVLALGLGSDGLKKLYAVPLAGGAPEVLATNATDDVGVMLDVYDGRPLRAGTGDAESDKWLDTAAAGVYAQVVRAFPGRDVELRSRSRDWNRVVVHVSGTSLPPTHYLVDLQKKTAEIVGESYPGLADVALGTVSAMQYAARDGTQIPAFLTLPPNREAKGLPLVVLPHGGPAAHDELEFNYLVQFLATRGYVVLQPQFRGSTGYGEAHRRAGYRQWGGLMQDDVTDGVKALVAQGVADPTRVCIVGISYGGYAALAGAAFTPDLYACAVSINGVSDLPAMLGHAARWGEDGDVISYWREHIGTATDPKVAERSPARSAEKVRAPILLLHGSGDAVVPIEQSELMALALARAGKRHVFVRIDGEDHWMSTGPMRVRVLTETERFLQTHLGAATGR